MDAVFEPLDVSHFIQLRKNQMTCECHMYDMVCPSGLSTMGNKVLP